MIFVHLKRFISLNTTFISRVNVRLISVNVAIPSCTYIYIWSVNPHFNSPYVFYLHIYWVMNINWHIFFFSSLLFFVNEFIGRACSLELRTLSCFSKVHDILRVDFVGYLFSFSWFVILFCWWFWLKKKVGRLSHMMLVLMIIL